MSTLPVRQMVLYKHGVGFFVREGAVSGEHLALTFRQDEINDVLKSLAVFDKAGGQVLGIHYQTPMDKKDRLQNTSIRLSTQHTLSDLLRDLRGRSCTLDFETTPGTVESVTGRVMGINQPNDVVAKQTLREGEQTKVALLEEAGQVRVFDFEQLRAVTIHDEQSGQDLRYFLDTSMSEDSRRTVTVRLSAGEHDVAVYYVAPSPTWRVSYRLVAETDDNGETGTALLQGWGLFDNRLEEDLNDVRVTLVAGQPISFIYDLYESIIPERPLIKDQARIAPGPIEYEAELDMLFGSDAEPVAAVGGQTANLLQMQDSASHFAPAAAKMTRGGMAQSAPAAAETKDTGQFFQYIVTAPVTVKRGESALVPIIGSDVKYERELLYNGSKLPKHPVASLRFENSTGLTLERGPVTVVEDGDYKGEAVIPFTKADNQVYVPYAVELGIKVTEHPHTQTETVSINIEDGLLIFEERWSEEVTYTLENTTSRDENVTIEAKAMAHLELFDTPSPDYESANERRWRVHVRAQSSAKFVHKVRRPLRRRENLMNLRYQDLLKYLENRWLDQHTFDELSEILTNLEHIQRAKNQQKKLKAEQEDIYNQQEQLRKNLGALQTTGKEAGFRDRLLAQLEASQDRLDDIDTEYEAAEQRKLQADKQIDAIIAGLNAEKTD